MGERNCSCVRPGHRMEPPSKGTQELRANATIFTCRPVRLLAFSCVRVGINTFGIASRLGQTRLQYEKRPPKRTALVQLIRIVARD